MISKLAWRRDPVEAVTVRGACEQNEATECRWMPVGGIRRWSRAVRARARSLLARFPEVPVGFEGLLHPFVVAMGTAVDRAAVEAALLQAVQKLAPAARVDLISESGQSAIAGSGGREHPGTSSGREGGESNLEIPLRSGAAVHGRLRICSPAGGRLSLTPPTTRRLLTLCTLAASALENIVRRPGGHWDHDAIGFGDLHSHAGLDGHEPHVAKEFISTPMLRDATFLSVVLPFALTQAQRHREPLSLLWVEIDRLAGIRDLLGRATADHLVRRVGEAVTALLRSSDIVARLEDDRIVVILPRATIDDALFVAHKIGRDVAEKNRVSTVMPGVTVSTGVATFPTCAHSVSSLFIAADEALAQARSQGRGQAVMAPPRPALQPTPHAQPRNVNPSEKLTNG